MTTPTSTPGWYPDPAGAGSRWWDGRSWTEFRSAPAVTVIAQAPLPAGTSTGTRWSYLQALVPLVQVLVEVPSLLSFRSLFAAQLALMSRADGDMFSSPATSAWLSQSAGVYGISAVTSLVAFLLQAGWVVLALLDTRRLERLGVVQPFHWAWSLLGLVYPIGRAVVLHRRVGGGLAPLWVLIGAVVASTLAGFSVEALVLLPLFADFASSAAASGAHCGC